MSGNSYLERLRAFNNETGVMRGGNSHPDRCVCQRKEVGRYADTPHKHREEPPYGCARCGPDCAGYKPEIASTDVREVPQPPMEHGACFDCGRRDGDAFGFPDLHVPDDVWALISPRMSGGGLLCPSCICGRLHRFGITTVATWESGPLMHVETPKPAPQEAIDLFEYLEHGRKSCLDVREGHPCDCGLTEAKKAFERTVRWG